MKKKNYRVKRGVLLLLINVYAILFITIIVLNISMYSSNYFLGFVSEKAYIKNNEINNNVVNKLILDCDNYEDANFAHCINNNIYKNFSYVRKNHIVRFDNLLSDGGDCKSWSTLYFQIFKKKGWDVQFIHIKDHVFLTASKENIYCVIDQTETNCYERR